MISTLILRENNKNREFPRINLSEIPLNKKLNYITTSLDFEQAGH